MVVEFPRKLYFPYVRSREATAFVLKKRKKDRSAENGVSFFGSQMRFSSSGERWVTEPLARSSWWTSRITGLTNGRARERVSVLNAFSMGW